MYSTMNSEKILDALRLYDEAIWPLPILACLLGLVIVLLALHRVRAAGRFIASLLALFWVWVGVEYHAVHLGHLYPRPEVLTAMFVFQGMLLFWHGVLGGRLAFCPRGDLMGLAGGLLIGYALAGYPLVSEALGRGALGAPLFGVAPGPTAVFTLGLFLWSEERLPWDLMVVPLIWAAVGSHAAWRLGLGEDLMLAVAGVVSAGLLARRAWQGRQRERAASQACRA